ncbi:MAG: histidinol dehydrogenase [Acidimicrobiia bacterium]
MIPRIDRSEVGAVARRHRREDADTMRRVAAIVEQVRAGGAEALRRLGVRFGDIDETEPLVVTRDEMGRALDRLPDRHRAVLEAVADRIRRFAAAQRAALTDLTVPVHGGTAGHRWIPVERAGAYAPAGRYPLPSSVLMTVIPARVAAVDQVWVASPRPSDLVLAATSIADADALIPVGGAQAIAALAFGTVGPACDLVVGPGNRWVTAAKRYLYGEIGIDGLAGPSEILVIADDEADPDLVASDLLAQAEHDPDAVPMLVTLSSEMADEVVDRVEHQVVDLTTADIAGKAVGNGFCVVVDTIDEAASVSDEIAPEHLALHIRDAEQRLEDFGSYGSVFVGATSAEVFADYGAGPNHVLPTGGGARFQSGLSVLTFLRSPTWLVLDEPDRLVDDTALLASLEGLVAHETAARRRSGM